MVANALSLYCRYASVSLRGQLQYRASFIMQTVGIFVITAIEFLGIWAMFDRFGQVRGWTLPEVALFYGMISVTWAICDALGRGFDQFGATVKAGDFDRILLRPRSTVLQLIGQELTLRRVGRFAQGLIILGFAAHALESGWTIFRAALLMFAITCGVCMFLGLVILQATSAFWTTETLEVWNAFTYGGVTMSQYPIDIYRPWFRKFFMFVIPIACINYFPAIAILGRVDPLGTTAAVQMLAPLAGPTFLLLCLQCWKLGVRHYRSTGS
jgi:ABC-2 type transport system permease protein